MTRERRTIFVFIFFFLNYEIRKKNFQIPKHYITLVTHLSYIFLF